MHTYDTFLPNFNLLILTMEEEARNLHIFMVPWLAMGHLLPFFELSKRLAHKGIKISFFSTPSNILRLPSIPQSLKPFLNLIPCSLRSNDNLPFNIDNTFDLHFEADRPGLNQAYAAFEPYLIDFLSNPRAPKPNWIIYDLHATNWAPSLASRFNANAALFYITNAATAAFTNRAMDCESPEELTRLQDRFPFATTINFLPFEARRAYPLIPKKAYFDLESNPLLLIKTCKELDGKWLDLIGDKYFPVGFIPASSNDEENAETWGSLREWLDKREELSVVYVAFGTEVELTREQIDEIGLGLEKSGLPFIWVLRVGLPPRDFEERTGRRGLVLNGWVPQAKVLAHPAVGGLMTHGGWNAIVEGLVFGTAMVALPIQFEQGLNARHLVESGYAVEVERNGEDGSFTGEDIGRKLRMVMVEEEGEKLRKKAKQGKEIFGNEKLHEEYIAKLIKKLAEPL